MQHFFMEPFTARIFHCARGWREVLPWTSRKAMTARCLAADAVEPWMGGLAPAPKGPIQISCTLKGTSRSCQCLKHRLKLRSEALYNGGYAEVCWRALAMSIVCKARPGKERHRIIADGVRQPAACVTLACHWLLDICSRSELQLCESCCDLELLVPMRMLLVGKRISIPLSSLSAASSHLFFSCAMDSHGGESFI